VSGVADVLASSESDTTNEDGDDIALHSLTNDKLDRRFSRSQVAAAFWSCA
jgi:hypothetical protein